MKEFVMMNQPAEVREAEDPRSIRQFLAQAARDINSKFLKVARYLYIIKEREMFLNYGYSSFADFVEGTPELNFDLRTAQMLIRIWKYFGIGKAIEIDQEDLIDIGYLKSYYLTMLFDKGKLTQENLDEWVEKAKSMSTRMFKVEVDKALGKYDKTEEELSWKNLSIRVPVEYLDTFEEVAQEMAMLEGIEDEDEVRKRRGELIAKALEDWRGYYEHVVYNEQFRNSQELRMWKLKQIKELTEQSLGVTIAVFDKDTGERIF